MTFILTCRVTLVVFIWVEVFKNGPGRICGSCITSNFLKAVFYKFYLVHSWIAWSICFYDVFFWNCLYIQIFLTAKCWGGSRTAATSKMERFVIIVNGWKQLTIMTKRSILDVAAVLGPPLICEIRVRSFSARCTRTVWNEYVLGMIVPLLTHLFPMHLFSTPWKHQKTIKFADNFSV